MVSGEPPKRARKKRRARSEVVHMEHAGTHSGELKNLIRAGRELIRRVEERNREEEADSEESDSEENGDNDRT